MLSLIGLLVIHYANAQSVATLTGARANGIGNASSCLADEWSIFNNIAGLAKVKETTLGFSCDARPQLKAANRIALTYVNPIKFGVVGFGLFHFGDPGYNEQVASFAFSNTFGITSLGVKANYIQYNAEGFGARRVLSLSLGALTQLTPQLCIGIYALNINKPKISDSENERIPALLIAGLGFTPSEKILITTEIEKDLLYKPKWKTGLEYQAHKKIFFRTGFTINSDAIYFGLGFQPKKLKLDYAYGYNPNTGGSHQASVAYKFASK